MANPNPHLTEIPLAYRLWFMYIDPFLSLVGTYGAIFSPNLILASYIPDTVPNPVSPKDTLPNPLAVVNPAHQMVFSQLGGFFLLTCILSTFLLRYTRDLNVWRLYQGAIFPVDVIILAATGAAYAQQGRLSPLAWRAEDWFSVVVTGACAVLRAGIVLGVGIDGRRKTR